MTNTQTDSGDELEQMLKAFQHDVAATGYPMNTPGQDALLAGATKALKQYIQAREREADHKAMLREATHRANDAVGRLWRLDREYTITYLQEYLGKYNLQIGQPNPQAGDGGEV